MMKPKLIKITIDTENGICEENGRFRIGDGSERKQAILQIEETEYLLYSYVKDENMFGNGQGVHETMLFACDADGTVHDFMDIASFDGYVSIEDVLENIETETTMAKERE